jgi:hypothetical protein
MLFFKHRRTDKKYRRFLKGRAIYFSIRPTRAGFSDQLLRFTAIYKIGKYLGLHYFHIPFQPKPLIIETGLEADNSSGMPEKLKDYSIYDFIGLNTSFNSTNPGITADEMEIININLTSTEFEKYKISYFSQMICFLEVIILKSLENSLKPVFLVNFKLSDEIPALIGISAGIPNQILDFDLKEIYLKYRETNPHRPKFDNDKIKLLMHSRQGDTAVIKTPWNTFIQVWSRKANSFIEFNQIHQINDVSIVTVEDFYSFYKNLKQVFGEEKLSSLLFSDGFARSFFRLFAKTGKLNFTEQQVEKLHEWALTYNQEAFKKFEDLVELNMFIGEEIEKLYDLVHSFLHSDIVIFGTQQRMIPKLYALYFRKNDGPLCFVLYRKKMVSYDYLSNSQMSKNFVFVDLDNYDILEIYGRIMNFLKERKKAQFKYSDISKL